MLRRLILVAMLTGPLSPGCDRPDVNFPQVHRDRIVTWALLGEIDELFNQNLSGQPAGPQDITSDCPLGGSVHITGDLTTADGARCDLLFDLTDCKFERSSASLLSADLTLTGQVNLQRNLTGADSFGNVDFTATGLKIRGDIASTPDQASVSHDCDLSATISDSATVGAVAGELCNRPVSWIYYQSSCGF